MRIHLRKAVAALAATLVVPGIVLSAGPAHAVDTISPISLSPSSGAANAIVSGSTDAVCPANTYSWMVEMTGPGIADANGILKGANDYNDVNPARNDHGGLDYTNDWRFNEVFQKNALKQPTGDYDIWLRCYDVNSGLETVNMKATVTFTPTGTDYMPTYQQKLNGQATSTTLAAAPLDPVAAGTSTTLTATVSPGTAAGKMQFKRGGVALGAPVDVASGTATYTGALPAGNGSLIAEFQPTSPASYAGSTSAAVPYLVLAAPTITGTVRVGSTVTCGATTGGTQTYAWLRSGAPVAGFTARTANIPATWVNAAIACRVTTTKDGRSLRQTSAAKKVAPGVLRNTARPVLKGTPRVGQKLTCTKGTWSPAPTSFAFAWLRDGRVIAGRTTSTYLLARTDKGHLIACRVTAKKAGYTNGVAKSAAKRIG
jgi:hypothetical protein